MNKLLLVRLKNLIFSFLKSKEKILKVMKKCYKLENYIILNIAQNRFVE